MLKIYTHHRNISKFHFYLNVHSVLHEYIVGGLEKLGIPHVYQDENMPGNGDRVIVLSDPVLLNNLIEYKQVSGKDFTLLAGPCFTSISTHSTGLSGLEQLLQSNPSIGSMLNNLDPVVLSKHVNGIISASHWASYVFWESVCPDLAHKCFVWPAGVDTDYWKRQSNSDRDQVLLYEKNLHDCPQMLKTINQCIDELQKRNIKYIHQKYIKFGDDATKYSHEEFKSQLENCRYAIVFSSSETQGLALAEMWSMDVPTLCWDTGSHQVKEGPFTIDVPSSSAPYLSIHTGWRWKSLGQLIHLIDTFNPKNHQPREWTIKNMSDVVSAKKLLDIFELLENKTAKR